MAVPVFVPLQLQVVPLVSVPRAVTSVVLLVFGFFLLRGIFTTLRTTWLVRNTPTATVHSMAVGRTEVEGTARPERDSFPQPFTKGSAVVGEYRVVKHDPDADGEESGWTITESGTIAAPFTLDDGTGEVRVAASEDAELFVSETNTTSVTVPADEPEPAAVRRFLAEYTNRDVDPDADGSVYDRKHRYVQEVIPPDESVYVFGTATPRDDATGVDADRLEIQRDDDTGRFVISDEGQPAVLTELRRRIPVLLVLGLLLSIVGFRLLLIELGVG